MMALPTDFPDEVHSELEEAVRAEEDGNIGKARVCARRAVGKAFALTGYHKSASRPLSANESLKLIAGIDELSQEVRDAARRLSTSVADAAPLSTKPVQDAISIIKGILHL